MLVLVICLLILVFGFVVLFGAPYLPTRKKAAEDALDLMALKKSQTMLELGSGDGRVLRLAAARGLKVVGYEINPVLVLISLVVTFKYRKNVRIIWGNYWLKRWPPHDAIYVFLLESYMPKLDARIKRNKKQVMLVSNAFEIPNKKPTKKYRGLFYYEYK